MLRHVTSRLHEEPRHSVANGNLCLERQEDEKSGLRRESLWKEGACGRIWGQRLKPRAPFGPAVDPDVGSRELRLKNGPDIIDRLFVFLVLPVGPHRAHGNEPRL